MTAILLHALGCANGAAMAALKPREIDTLSDAEIMERVLPLMGRTPMATSEQLNGWLLNGLDGINVAWWDKVQQNPRLRQRYSWLLRNPGFRRAFEMARAKAQAQAAAPVTAAVTAVTATSAAPVTNWATLHGLDDLEGWGKRLKRLKKNLRKVAKFAVMPTQGGIKGIKAQFKFAKNNKGLLVGAAGLLTANPALMKIGKELNNYDKSRRAQDDYNAMAARAGVAPVTDSAMTDAPASAAINSSYAGGGYSMQPAEGQVTRLAQPDSEDRPRVVGFNWGGIVDNMKENPVPWALGGATALYLLTRSNRNAA